MFIYNATVDVGTTYKCKHNGGPGVCVIYYLNTTLNAVVGVWACKVGVGTIIVQQELSFRASEWKVQLCKMYV